MEKKGQWSQELHETISITEKNTKKIWHSSLRNVLLVLKKVNLYYLHPEHFFKLIVPLVYKPYNVLRSEDVFLGIEFPFDTAYPKETFFQVYRYWETFHKSSDTPMIPSFLFGALWSALAIRNQPSSSFDTQYRKVFQHMIQITCEHTTSTNLFESGFEYVAITGTLSAILQDYVMGNSQKIQQMRQDCELLEFFIHMTQSKPFQWTHFFRTLENAERYEYLIRHIIYFMAQKHSSCKDYMGSNQDSISIPIVQSFLMNEDYFPLFFILVQLWEMYQNQVDEFNKLPRNKTFLSSLVAKLQFRPTPSHFTMIITRDPLAKNESGILFFVQFYGLHPAFWYPCSKMELFAMTPHALKIESKSNAYQSAHKFLFPVSDFTTCKLNKPERVNAIIDELNQGTNTASSILQSKQDLSFYPWFRHEHKVFEKLKCLPSFNLKKKTCTQ